MARRPKASFSDRLQALRKERNFSLRDLARATDLSATYLSQLEHGRSTPTDNVVIKIAEALEADQDELLALLGRIAKDLQEIVLRRPREVSDLLLAINDLPSEDLEYLREIAESRLNQQKSKR
jgi:transcriptional regulator with XRE-family HTH domain